MHLKNDNSLFEYLVRLGDDRLILGHRLSEWCGHAPILEEDIALANIAQDCIGHATHFLNAASEVENKIKTADELAYFRDAIDYKNLLIMELPKGDFAFTIVRQFLVDSFTFLLYEKLQNSGNKFISDITTKALKEVQYHLRHSSQWVLRLGDGTELSHEKTQNALNILWLYTNEMFESDEIENSPSLKNFITKSSDLESEWENKVISHLQNATLKIPEMQTNYLSGGRRGIHTEHLGHLLSEMQIVARTYPGAKW
ncbi:MAG: phenylacetate-CoA oxygenase subunit PaaI [Bacteroidetes bacterium]|nr:phenylacetate-CoA oxygenase subunit PaaI [Bacteroidota bacterium]